MCHAFKRTFLVLSCITLVFCHCFSAWAEPDNIDQKRAEAAEIRNQLNNIDEEFDVAVEKYNQANIELDQTRKIIEKTKSDIKITTEKLNNQKEVFSSRVANIYKNGSISLFSAFVGAQNFSTFLTRLSYLIQIGKKDIELLQKIHETQNELEQKDRKLENQKQEQIKVTEELKSKKNQIEGKIASRQAFLGTIENDIQEMIRNDEEQEARTLAQEARNQQPNRENNQNTTPQNPPNNGGNNPSNTPKTPPSTPSAPSGPAHSQVVAIAMLQLGKPYQWAAAGPNSFDCSGLVMYCYAQIGISLPHSAAAQYNRGIKLDRGSLSPGDLVFFGRTGVSHVGIYVGGNSYIHAPRTGDVVKVSSLSSRSDYYGACRP